MKAIAYAKEEEHSYQNCYEEPITVSFRLLLEVQQSSYKRGAVRAGTEVYSRYFRNYAAYKTFEPLLKGKPF